MRRPEGTCASCWQPHPPSQERCFGPPEATERTYGETTTDRLESFLLDATNPRQDVAARAHGFQIDEAKRLAGWLRSATANDTLTADDFGLAPPSTPVERPAAITDEMLRAAETHHGDSCSYCTSTGDIDCPTAAVLDALAAATSPAPGDNP